jgi:hypothetical protein
LLDIGIPELYAEVTWIKPDAATWENLNIVVYVLKESQKVKNSLPGYLTKVEAPKYHSLKKREYEISENADYYTLKFNNSNKITRIRAPKKRSVDYHNFLKKHSKDDSIKDLIYTHLNKDTDYGVEDRLFVIRKTCLNYLQDSTEIERQAEKWMNVMHIAFDDKEGYIVLKLKEAAKIIPKITKLAETADKMGNQFIELVL